MYLSLCRLSGGLCCDWMSRTKEAGLSCLQVVVGGAQTHLSLVGGVYPSFYLASDREKKNDVCEKKTKNISDVHEGF